MSIGEHNDVISQTVNKMGMCILNRPKALNSLSFSMMRKLHPQLLKWENDPAISFVVLKGAGKAFCAGGDIKALTQTPEGINFFKEEYPLDYTIGTYKKPFISLITGITMGGGFGLSVHGKYRVASEKTMFAMPETSIGLVPDVGGGYVLPRLQGKLGIYLGLTGFRLKGRDVHLAGIATHFVDSNKVSTLEEELAALDNPDHNNIQNLLDQFHKESTKESHEFILEPKMEDINRSFSATTVEQIFTNLEKDGSEWALKQLETLKKMSPTSMKITLRQLKEGANLSLKECFYMENRLCQRCIEDHDLREGVRAVLIDKDQNPQWKPARLEDVTDERVDYYFSKLPDDRELVMQD
ncbi:hypothetical protein LOTGIDRAFT_177835 [Lottia gigantea]|uniref:3-hydroxyisobutyryl-CoA hydrolase, mitochondrial n=1 Tax=Lottia gigantea TaxID=225164 RepID=V4B5S6_LOTGI|nr:hypothetical protein LOTGIDRAFT_177835 [Lottia gigantea]ESP02886.1 hypothetical protein LOTGIDRAFT_177835 [Lottia gigantea]